MDRKSFNDVITINIAAKNNDKMKKLKKKTFK